MQTIIPRISWYVLVLQWGSIGVSIGLLMYAMTLYFDGGYGRAPSAIAFGATGWALLGFFSFVKPKK